MAVKFNIKDTFNKKLPADSILENSRRQVEEARFSYVRAKTPNNLSLLRTLPKMLAHVGLLEEDGKTKNFLHVLSGAVVLPNPYAMCYAGHQFGNWVGQLG